MAKSVKLADIAKKLGVSAVTVSKALSGQKGVSEEMRGKIIELADELGYKQPSSNKKQQSSKNFSIAVIVHERYLDKYDSFYLRLYQKIAASTASMGCLSMMEVVTFDAERECKIPMLIEDNKADGFIIMGKFSKEYIFNINKRVPQAKCVYLDSSDARLNVDSVISDSFYGAYYLTNYLFEMGHREIGFFGNVMATSSITDRYLGYSKSLMEHGEERDTKWIIDDRSGESGCMYLPEEITLPKILPTAFVCNCDLAASALIKRLENEGYKVPEDFSVVGYDNFLFPGLCDVELTTYEVDMDEMVRVCLDILIKKLEGVPYKSGINIVEGKLIVRESVNKVESDF
ncbi:LacI family DNA-binding transcriptional regulator [Pseudobutyrivibrio ruminis]|uniref:Transcriptional regulator n=1 Tax=Pseudobutyrivibrio ruminis TaxID=46206 RepID=A0A2G3DWW7_9FIRM|nr:LacI family DNA-binding transcriptional regulator [Pseudobutyrivibrio ruminis]PHU35526.1 transcriptional regulator [Pseudobutyrivibrio ruminis]